MLAELKGVPCLKQAVLIGLVLTLTVSTVLAQENITKTVPAEPEKPAIPPGMEESSRRGTATPFPEWSGTSPADA